MVHFNGQLDCGGVIFHHLLMREGVTVSEAFMEGYIEAVREAANDIRITMTIHPVESSISATGRDAAIEMESPRMYPIPPPRNPSSEASIRKRPWRLSGFNPSEARVKISLLRS